MKKEDKNEKRITVRLTPEQEESIREKAVEAMMSPNAFLRAAGMRHKIVVIKGMEEVAHELKGIGRNLNQLTTLANMGIINRVDLSGITGEIEKVYGKLTELMTMESR